MWLPFNFVTYIANQVNILFPIGGRIGHLDITARKGHYFNEWHSAILQIVLQTDELHIECHASKKDGEDLATFQKSSKFSVR